MNSKIIFFDIDGTILSNTTKRISDSTKAAIQQARANGHLTFINTGRTIGEIDKNIIDIGFDGYVCGCGTYITYTESILYKYSIPFSTIQEIMLDLRNLHIEAILEGPTAVYYNDSSTSPLVKNIKAEHSIAFDVQSWEASDISVDKFCIWPKSKEAYLAFYEKYKDSFDFITREDNLSEVIPIGHSKGTGISFLLNHLNIPQENTYALGDSTNDLTMLQSVKHSIAMGNSCKEILELVSYVTDDEDHDGVANALKHFNII